MQNRRLWYAAYAGCAAALSVFFAAGGGALLQARVAVVAREAQAAAIFFVQSITAAQIQDGYRGVAESPVAVQKKVRVLIVPGHQPDTGGTEFGGVKERDVVVDIADALATLFSQNPHYEVMVARTKTEWNPILQNYFDTHILEIDTFKQSQAAQMQNYIANGSILSETDQVYHNSVSSQAAFQLYGINKWASDNHYDITLHLHINDMAGRRARAAGEYDGFAIYVPDHQYSNAAASTAIADAIAVRLNAYHATSTLPKEDRGVVPDQQLIAIGSNNTVEGAALLIEYGYIYEPQFQKSSVRPLATAEYAYQTYLGLQDFFNDPLLPSYGSMSFPYDWEKVEVASGISGPGIYALQAALHHLGYYPPAGKSFSECPVSGRAGPCTRAAIEKYQKAHNIDATGTLGPKTRSALTSDLTTP